MNDEAVARREWRRSTWTSKVYRGPDVHAAMAADAALDEWTRMGPVDRVALTRALARLFERSSLLPRQ